MFTHKRGRSFDLVDQQTAWGILKSGKSVFLTGSAGAGKTWILSHFIAYLRKQKIPVAITASTGVAATHLNGMTLHSFCGMGRHMSMDSKQIKKIMDRPYITRNINRAKVLIIDEVSMLHRRQLDLAERIISLVRSTSLEPFGGLQVVFCGDFFQLPPVGEHSERAEDKFAFLSDAWKRLNPELCYLSSQHRQTENDELARILNEIRFGNIGTESIQLLRNAKKDLGKDPIRLYSHNWDVDQYNQSRLDELKGSPHRFKAKMKGNENLLEAMKKGLLVQEDIELKNGARIVMLKNNFDEGYVNGSTGTVNGFDSENGWPLIELDNGLEITAKPEDWSMEDDSGKKLATFTQIPLRLAWAITVHKSQGMTLDAAELDLGKCFEYGQGYVALSRLKSIEGLHLKGFNGKALEVDPLASKADELFRQLSEKTKENYAHLREEVVRSPKDKTKPTQGAQKSSTYEITAVLLKQGLDLVEIAHKRSITPNTVLNHIAHLMKQGSNPEISHLRPDVDFILMLRTCIEQLLSTQSSESLIAPGGQWRIKPVFDALKGKYSYDDIRLGMLFVGNTGSASD